MRYEPLLIPVLVGCLVIFLEVRYIRTLQRALQRCSEDARTIKPGLVWLLLIPLVNLFWQFVLVDRIAASLRNEFTRRGMQGIPAHPARMLGVAMSILGLASLLPHMRLVLAIPALLCWANYWAKVWDYSQLLAPPTSPQSAFPDAAPGHSGC